MAETLDLMRGFVCGTISGWAQVFVMQPFEIIKVRLVNQSLFNPEYNGIIHCFQRILKEEGFKSFYKGNLFVDVGTLSPLLGYGIQGSLAFGSNELFKELISYIDKKSAV
jgi:solute carrier family 25 (mitochondrial carnitine/acylcarnitine transporter), member 20/29